MNLPARFTIERAGSPGRRARHLGHTGDGRLMWIESFALGNTFDTQADAISFRRNRLGDSAEARVVRHTVH